MIDTFRSVETPEGVELSLRIAGPPVRMLAWIIDTALRYAVYLALAMMFAVLDDAGFGLFLLLFFAGETLYPVLFEVLRGATPGKMIFGLVVLHRDGTPVGWSASILRNLVRFADFFPVAYGFGLISMLADRDSRRLGDLAAGTVVVYRDRPPRLGSLPAAGPVPPPRPLAPAERRAIVDFAERLPRWTPERARELGSLAEPLTGASGAESVGRLLGYANWLVGRR